MTAHQARVWRGLDLSAVSPPSDPGSPHEWEFSVEDRAEAYLGNAWRVVFHCRKCGFARTTSVNPGSASVVAGWVQAVRRMDVLPRCDDQMAREVMES